MRYKKFLFLIFIVVLIVGITYLEIKDSYSLFLQMILALAINEQA